MDLESIKITDIVPAEYNPRKVSYPEYEKLKSSIQTFGFVDPIIVNLKNMKIVGGHQRYDILMDDYLAGNTEYSMLKLIRLGDVGWVFTNENLNIKDESHEKALNVALNKISGEWDNEKLKELFTDLQIDGFELTNTGFDDVELTQLNFEEDIEFFDDVSDDLGEDDFDDLNEPDATTGYEVTCPECGHKFIIKVDK